MQTLRVLISQLRFWVQTKTSLDRQNSDFASPSVHKSIMVLCNSSTVFLSLNKLHEHCTTVNVNCYINVVVIFNQKSNYLPVKHASNGQKPQSQWETSQFGDISSVVLPLN